jgi:hypothetical protein
MDIRLNQKERVKGQTRSDKVLHTMPPRRIVQPRAVCTAPHPLLVTEEENCRTVAFCPLAATDLSIWGEAVCPQTSDSGQRNLLNPALANQSLAVSRREGFLGKWFVGGVRAPNRARVEIAI